MKKILLSALFMVAMSISTAVIAQTKSVTGTTTPTAATIKFDKQSHNFGNIPQNLPVTIEFTFKNTGKTPLVIASVNASCGCTTPSYTKAPVMPGGSGSVKAQYNAAAIGEFNKTITVASNAGEVVVLTIQGTVIGATTPTTNTTTTPAK